MKSKKVATKKPNKKELLTKQVAADNRRIAADNKAFQKMTPAEKRVQIARDVLAQLATKRLVAKSGTWLAGEDGADLFDDTDAQKDPELQKILSKTKTCEGCALGGMFMCAVERADKLKLSELSNVEVDSFTEETYVENGEIEGEDAFKYLGRFFSQKQLNLIETCFEQGEGAGETSEGERDLALDFFSEVSEHNHNDYGDSIDVPEPSVRMTLIMQNIIVNKGKFDPTKKPIMVFATPGFVG